MTAIRPLTPLQAGVATVNVIVDALESYELVSLPDNRKRTVAWVSPFLEPATLELPVAQNLVCFLLSPDNAFTALEAFPMAMGLLLLEEGEQIPERLQSSTKPLTNRLIVARKRPGSLPRIELQALLQTMLFELYRWNERCREIVNWDGSIQTLVDTSAPLFGNWIDVTDATYTLLAHTRDIEPPDALSKKLVELGCHDVSRVAAARESGVFGEWVEQSGIGVFDPIELVPFTHVTYIMKTDRVYQGHVVMVCNNASPTPGLVDLFETFAQYCEKIVVGGQGSSSAKAPYEGFLAHLLDNHSPHQDYIENQKAIIGIGDSTTFCLAAIDNSEGSYAEQSLLLLTNAKSELPKALTMLYENTLIALFYAPNFDPAIISEQLGRLDAFCERFDCTAYRSSVFFAIEDLYRAWQQAEIARKYRFAVENSRILSPDGGARTLVYRFSDAFGFLLGDSSPEAQELVDFSAANSHLDIIERLQLDNNVCDLKVLYHFLVNERKATPTAEQLHMHRNNVLHRMKTIEKRYHLNLDDYFTRQYLLACFRLKIDRSAKFRKMLL